MWSHSCLLYTSKHLGTEQQFKALLDAAHSKGMKIMVDVVLNHAGYGTEKYFNSILTDADGNSISMIRDSNNTISGDDKYDSLSDLPDFVTENKAVKMCIRDSLKAGKKVEREPVYSQTANSHGENDRCV